MGMDRSSAACDAIDPRSELPRKPSSYALVLRVRNPCRIRVGRLGILDFPVGLYIYVGSAFGPGGLRARIKHHMRQSSHPHWHIDFLRRGAQVERVWYLTGKRMECVWAARLRDAAGMATGVTGFGSSDCRCPTHLFHVADLGCG